MGSLPIRRLICAVAAATLLTAAQAAAKPVAPGDFRAAVITGVAEALGANPDATPAYAQELETERGEIQVRVLCTKGPMPGILFSDQLTAQVVDSTLRSLKAGRYSSTVNERPSYTTDLIVTTIAAFELGRLAALPEEARAAACAPAPA